jgi:alcohol dehydrogenase (cytochrome c)
MKTMRSLTFTAGLLCAIATAWGQADWPQHSADYASTGYSKLTGITPKNVSNLHQLCSYPLGEDTTFESSLVEVNGTLYFTGSQYTYALDAASCALKWRVRHEMQGPGGTVRGVGFADGRVYRGFSDGYIIAYDARNGEQVWSSQLKETNGMPATIAASPLIWNGMLFIGTSGAERACGCVIAGLDAKTGKVVWTFAVVPEGDAKGAESWPKGVHIGGGSVWTSLSIDPQSGALYVPTGNPGPDFSGAYRPGANLYTGSIVVLDAMKGSLRTWYQLVPHDIHDWDQAAAPALITTKAGQHRAMAGGKDGFLHAIDITAGKVAWKTPVATIENADAPLTPEGTHVCPGAGGAVLWNGPAYSPATNLVYVNSMDQCSTLKLDTKLPEFEAGKMFLGSANAFGDNDPMKTGWVTAVDADSGMVRWRNHMTTPMVAGIAVTASGLLMTADLNGDFLAYDAATGKELHRIATGKPGGGGVITYQAGGSQKVAMAAGLEDRIIGSSGKAEVIVFGLK